MQSHEAKPCSHHSASDGPSGYDGVGITAEAAQRPKCTASSSWGNVSLQDFDRQVAEFQVRFAVLDAFTALGMPVTEAVG